MGVDQEGLVLLSGSDDALMTTSYGCKCVPEVCAGISLYADLAYDAWYVGCASILCETGSRGSCWSEDPSAVLGCICVYDPEG